MERWIVKNIICPTLFCYSYIILYVLIAQICPREWRRTFLRNPYHTRGVFRDIFETYTTYITLKTAFVTLLLVFRRFDLESSNTCKYVWFFLKKLFHYTIKKIHQFESQYDSSKVNFGWVGEQIRIDFLLIRFSHIFLFFILWICKLSLFAGNNLITDETMDCLLKYLSDIISLSIYYVLLANR